MAAGVVVHDEFYETAAYACALATLTRPDFPVPVGVFREVEKPCYEDMLQEQVDDAVAQRGKGDLRQAAPLGRHLGGRALVSCSRSSA